MCGVPHHAAENYLAVLLDKGYTVAVCEQMEDPKSAKGLVKRAVTRVFTPGTVVEDAGLEAKGHNYLGAIYWDEGKGDGGFAWLDYSTGKWSGLLGKRIVDLWQWVLKLAPRELLIPDFSEEVFRLPDGIKLSGIAPCGFRPGAFSISRALRKKFCRPKVWPNSARWAWTGKKP